MSYRKQLLVAAYRQIRSTGMIDAVLGMELITAGVDPDKLIEQAPRNILTNS